MKIFLRIITIIIFCGISLSLLGQTQKTQLIKGNFSGISFDEFIANLEKQSSYRFYYNQDWTDTLRIELIAHNDSVEDLLRKLFADTNLNFFIDFDNRVYITDNREIHVDLPEGYFSQDSSRTVSGIYDYMEYEREQKQIQQTETKLFVIGKKSIELQGNATLIGRVSDRATGEPVIGASVYIENPFMGTSTDQHGHFSLTLPKGRHELKLKSMGMKSTQRNVFVYSNGRLDIELEEDITPLKEVVIEANRDLRITGMEMGVERLDMKVMKQIPLALGEADIMKVILTLPGVQSVGEGTSGINVRGGATNQNLILFNDAVVFNPSHLFGFFSTFNPDILKSVELYKSGITADYGGRLSSVLNVNSKEGNGKKLSVTGGISPVTGRLTIEGPLVKNKTTFVLAGRSTYSNWLLRQLDSKSLKNSKANFYDIASSINHRIDDDNNLYASFYLSKDKFSLNNDTTFSYGDRNASLKWKHNINNKLNVISSISYSQYNFDISSTKNPAESFAMDFSVRQISSKIDFNYYPNPKHTLNWGVNSIRYNLSPGQLKPIGRESLIMADYLQTEKGLENSLYFSENYEINSRISVYLGLRYSFYNYLGPKDVYLYSEGVLRSSHNIIDTVHYSKNKNISAYHGAEPRFSIRYILAPNTSVKLSYNRMRQYIQMLSNTTAITPTDIWKLSDPYIKPQVGDQLSVGMYKNILGNLIETSVETYYKVMDNTVDFKNGAELLMVDHLETELLNAYGKAYGVEFMIKKVSGKINGWVNYTYSRSWLKTLAAFSSETVNNGNFYPSNFDKPHAVNFIGNYKFSRRFNFSLNVVYSTGRPITLPVGKYTIEGVTRVYYTDRNQYRIPDYFRSDISLNFEGNHKIRKLAHSSWTFAVYNLLGRANPYSVFFTTQNGQVNGYKLSVFARPIPTVTYNFKI